MLLRGNDGRVVVADRREPRDGCADEDCCNIGGRHGEATKQRQRPTAPTPFPAHIDRIVGHVAGRYRRLHEESIGRPETAIYWGMPPFPRGGDRPGDRRREPAVRAGPQERRVERTARRYRPADHPPTTAPQPPVRARPAWCERRPHALRPRRNAGAWAGTPLCLRSARLNPQFRSGKRPTPATRRGRRYGCRRCL
jgi:hypothetical protein